MVRDSGDFFGSLRPGQVEIVDATLVKYLVSAAHTDVDLRAMKGGVDLNGGCQIGQSRTSHGGGHEHGKPLYATLMDFLPWRPSPATRRAGGDRGDRALTCAEQSRRHGLRPTTTREPARYRSRLGTKAPSLPHGLSRAGSVLDIWPMPRIAHLAHQVDFAQRLTGQAEALRQRGPAAGDCRTSSVSCST